MIGPELEGDEVDGKSEGMLAAEPDRMPEFELERGCCDTEIAVALGVVVTGCGCGREAVASLLITVTVTAAGQSVELTGGLMPTLCCRACKSPVSGSRNLTTLAIVWATLTPLEVITVVI
jgi:hypothetical protein